MNTQEKIIRPSSRFWQQEIGATALLGIIFPIAAILYYGVEMYLAGRLALVVGIIYLISETPSPRQRL